MAKNAFESMSGSNISYVKVRGKEPYIVYFHGTGSSKTSSKGLFLQGLAKKTGYGFFSFDLTGHEESSGDYCKDGCLSVWKKDVVSALDFLDKRCIVVGHSLGGWLALLVALEMPCMVEALLLVSAAPDFTDDIMCQATRMMKKELKKDGHITITMKDGFQLRFSQKLLKDGRKHLLLGKKIEYKGSVTILQGEQDKWLDYRKCFKIKDALASDDVKLVLMKPSGHSMDDEGELEIIEQEVRNLLKKAKKNSRR